MGNVNACMCLSFPKQISSTSSRCRPPPPWIKGRVLSTAAQVLLQAPPSFLVFEPSSVRLFPKLAGARTHQGHLSPALSSHRLVQACSIHNFCHLSSTMCIYMHICTQTLSPLPCLSPLTLLLPPLPFSHISAKGFVGTNGILSGSQSNLKTGVWCRYRLLPGLRTSHTLPYLGHCCFSFIHASQGRVFFSKYRS